MESPTLHFFKTTIPNGGDGGLTTNTFLEHGDLFFE